jgi:hypothetical protein
MTERKMQTLEEYVAERGITVIARLIEQGAEWPYTPTSQRSVCDKWTVTLRRYGPERADDRWHTSGLREVIMMTLPFYQGIGHRDKDGKSVPPGVCDVLSCLISDSSVADYSSAGEWADDLGYESFALAEKVFKACVRQTSEFTEFLGGTDALTSLIENVESY